MQSGLIVRQWLVKPGYFRIFQVFWAQVLFSSLFLSVIIFQGDCFQSSASSSSAQTNLLLLLPKTRATNTANKNWTHIGQSAAAGAAEASPVAAAGLIPLALLSTSAGGVDSDNEQLVIPFLAKASPGGSSSIEVNDEGGGGGGSVAAVTLLQPKGSSASSKGDCQLNEFRCDSGQCVGLDRFCNGKKDCYDNSDEPRHCSPCNRTYYGLKGWTYNIQLHNPASSLGSWKPGFSYICTLTFIGGGGSLGDVIQLKFTSIFLTEKSEAEEEEGCKKTKLILEEPDRGIHSEFCHYSFLNKPYFSETNRLILTFQTNQLNSQVNFDFKLNYKFIGKEEATVRYGHPSSPLFRGNLLDGTPCSLLFNNCYRDKCSVQSPNYPGLYPRNVTCYYAIRHTGHQGGGTGGGGHFQVTSGERELLNNYHAVINLQTLHLNIQSRTPSNLTHQFYVKDFKDNCVDTLTVYDGYTIRDPILAKVCGSGKLQNITSSSNELLIEFHSTGKNLFYSQDKQHQHTIQGFNILASVQHIKLNSLKYVENHNCVFRISSLNNKAKSGYLESPNHTLPGGTLCVYHIQGDKHDLVWLQIIYYQLSSTYQGDSQTTDSSCNQTFLAIYDGAYDAELEREGKLTPLVRLCGNLTEGVRSCEYRVNRNTSRPCNTWDESYVSGGSEMTVRSGTLGGTVLDTLRFNLYYEFIDTRLDGVEIRKPCSRLITMPGSFHSPRNTFLFGRGGKSHLHCIYQFYPGSITLNIHLSHSSGCSSVYNPSINRYECAMKIGGGGGGGKGGKKSGHQPESPVFAQIKYYKVYSNDTRIQVHCFCSLPANNSTTEASSSSSPPPPLRFSSKYVQQIELKLNNMQSWMDASHFHFNGSYNKERTGEEADEESTVETYSSLSGLIPLANASVAILTPPSPLHYVYLFNSAPSPALPCSSHHLLVHFPSPTSAPSSSSPSPLKLCPNELSVYSPNYDSNAPPPTTVISSSPDYHHLLPPPYALSPNKLVVEYIASSAPAASLRLHYVMVQKQSESLTCDFYCAVIDGCLPAQVLCNGLPDCPDSSDESNCTFNYNYEYLLLGFLILFIVLLGIYIYHTYQKGRRRRGEGGRPLKTPHNADS